MPYPSAPAEETVTATPPAPRRTRLNIGWVMPPFVRELPVDAPDYETGAEQLYTLVTDLMAGRSDEERFRFALALGSQMDLMLEANVIYAGLCLLEVEGRPSGSTIIVSQIEHESDDDEELLRTTQQTLERTHPDDAYQRVELPCGPALSRIGASGFIISAQWSPTGQEVAVQQSQIQVYIPLPGTGEMLIFALDSPSSEDWELHSELFAEILKTIDWGTDQEVEDYRAMRQSAPATVEPADGVKQELYWHSSRLMDAVALHGSMGGGEITSLTCAPCWAKGLRSACSARHGWYIGDVTSDALMGALPRVVESFASQGWRTDGESTGERVRVWAGDEAPERSVGHAFTASVDTGAGTFTAEVTAPCIRASATTDSLFG
ncbi:hypothetical protein DY245_20760 [Streptomyces inhibens]|uniref:Uncharacterized protein n=1 Tax=Streptomyces inhibens TaxID=2293571 RepID=A0A371Q1I2_STRIH|nr:hypothetical protein [Streptomyces inhibens]REK88519.1 hypothetical protein DY245_20760 [Streptomyces inhibens]